MILVANIPSFLAVAALNEKALKAKYSDESVQAVGQCMLSCKNWVDAVLDADCLCIAINVTRSEAAIAGISIFSNFSPILTYFSL